jgi:hypothetical protein
MGWWLWLNFAVTAVVLVLAVAWIWARRHEERERESARLRREERLAAWQSVEVPEMPKSFPDPGTTTLDPDLVSRLREGHTFEDLRHFFGGYFHQDWTLDYEDEDDVIRAYVEDHAHLPEDVVNLLRDMDKLLGLGLSDGDLSEALDLMGVEYFPLTDTNAWLRTWRAKVFTEAKGG